MKNGRVFVKVYAVIGILLLGLFAAGVVLYSSKVAQTPTQTESHAGFSSNSKALPNPDFESWKRKDSSQFELESWYIGSIKMGKDIYTKVPTYKAIRSIDAYSGQYAVELVYQVKKKDQYYESGLYSDYIENLAKGVYSISIWHKAVDQKGGGILGVSYWNGSGYQTLSQTSFISTPIWSQTKLLVNIPQIEKRYRFGNKYIQVFVDMSGQKDNILLDNASFSGPN